MDSGLVRTARPDGVGGDTERVPSRCDRRLFPMPINRQNLPDEAQCNEAGARP